MTGDLGDRVGLGAMRLSIEGRPSRAQSEAIIRSAVEHGVRLIDTADSYHLPMTEPPGHNEELIASTIRRLGVKSDIDIATKGGHLRNTADAAGWAVCGHPAYLRAAAIASIRRLDTEAIHLYQLHRPDPTVPYEDSVGALADLVSDGLAVRVGISNVSLDQLRTAHSILGAGLWSVQNAHSIWRPLDPAIRAFCEEGGVRMLVRSPLGGKEGAKALGESKEVVPIARELHRTPHQLALIWAAQSIPTSIALIGATRTETWLEALASYAEEIGADRMKQIDALALNTKA